MRTTAVASGAGDVQGLPAGSTLMGFSARESAGSPAAASLILRGGTTAGDLPLVFITLAASGSQSGTLPAVDCPNGVFIDRLTGTSEIILYTL